MPRYEFTCMDCNHAFTLDMKIADYEKKGFRCPKCNSKNVLQQVSSFQTITAKKS